MVAVKGGIFIIQKDGSLTEMSPAEYENEDMIQELLAKYPGLIAGDQVDSAEPRRWLVVTRELGIPYEEGGSDRWSADHLFLDQDAIPTIIEVKRVDDTRIRREVVGQMLDYAANVVVAIPMEQIRAIFEERQHSKGADPKLVLKETLGVSISYEDYWNNVKNNIQNGKIRLLFVADEIPAELRRIVEFLNEQMKPAEVLAVEIRKFTGNNSIQALVPIVMGQTMEAQLKKRGSGTVGQQWDQESFMRKLEDIGQEEAKIARSIHDFAIGKGIGVSWMKNIVGSFVLYFDSDDGTFYPFRVTGEGKITWDTQVNYPAPFNDVEKRREILKRVQSIKGISQYVNLDKINAWSALDLPLRVLADDKARSEFFDILLWIKEELEHK